MSAAASEQVLQYGPSNQNRLSDACSGPDPWLSARFEPDFLVPVQFFDLTRRRSMLDGETRLLFAVPPAYTADDCRRSQQLFLSSLPACPAGAKRSTKPQQTAPHPNSRQQKRT